MRVHVLTMIKFCQDHRWPIKIKVDLATRKAYIYCHVNNRDKYITCRKNLSLAKEFLSSHSLYPNSIDYIINLSKEY